MSKALLGIKIGMSQMFTADGAAIPVTLIKAIPNKVLLHRTPDKDGYSAVQLALPKTAEKNEERFTAIKEFKTEEIEDNSILTVEQFAEGDLVEVVGISKGKGFQGVVKRHGFAGGPASHGHRHVLRKPGSIGSRFPQHVMKGKRMAGRMGAERVTVKNLSVATIDPENHVIALKGAVPGKRGNVVEIKLIKSAD